MECYGEIRCYEQNKWKKFKKKYSLKIVVERKKTIIKINLGKAFDDQILWKT